MLSNRRLVATCTVILTLNLAVLVVFVKYNAGEKCYVTINEEQPATVKVLDDFLSFGIDTSMIEWSGKVAWNNSRLRELAAALAPARIRLGGTMSDRLIFSRHELPEQALHCPANDTCHPHISKYLCHAIRRLCKHKPLPFFLLTAETWDSINDFCKATKNRLLFTFNVLLRDHNTWNDLNAKELIEYSKSKNYQLDWQLGNEPNSFRHVFNMSISPHILAEDFKKLRLLLDNNSYKKSLLVGPDTTRPQEKRPDCLKYMIEFLGNGSKYINVRSWHQYYLDSKKAVLNEFWDPETFDLLNQQIDTMKTHTNEYNNIPMWLTETSTSYGGGAPGLSNTFAGSPLWLDKLGLAAKNNITTVIRQSFVGGNYSMIDKSLEPLPDWWVSYLHKKLVGNTVLDIQCNCKPQQRMYGHCTKRSYTDDTSAITIFGVNLELSKAVFLLNGTAIHGSDLDIDEYILRGPSNDRQAKIILMNGWPLYYESPLPDLEPRHIKYGNHISMPPYSIGFWVVKNTSITVCK